MKAMIMAAGLGTRLKPITDRIPKALVEIEGEPLLGRAIEVLKQQGFDYIVVNVHHFAEKIRDYLNSKDFGVRIEISDESDELLDTGGGIIKAKPLLFPNSEFKNKGNHAPVLFYNVDIIGNADLRGLIHSSKGEGLLLVSERESTRKLIFDKDMKLKGWHNLDAEAYRPGDLNLNEDDRELSFSGIYILSEENVKEMEQLLGFGKNSVIEYFLHPKRKQSLRGVEQPGLEIIDIGKPETLARFMGK